MSTTQMTKMILLAASCGLVALAGCGNRATNTGTDGGETDTTITPVVPPTGCAKRPAGSCVSDADCGAGMRCAGGRKTVYELPGCTVDPCCATVSGTGASDRAYEPDAGAARKRPPGTDPMPENPFYAPNCVDCLGTCVPATATVCKDSSDCDEGSFCQLGPGCAQPGTCQPRGSCGGSSDQAPGQQEPDPGFAPQPADGGGARPYYPPPDDPPMGGVCGCDGLTYADRCSAAAAGVSVSNDGPCGTVPPGGPCLSNAECSPGAYCTPMTDLAACVGPNAPGWCMPLPAPCPKPYSCPMVCGCDGKSYCTACEANAAGVNVAQAGACQTAPDPLCAGVTCIVQNDCCGCSTFALGPNDPPPPMPPCPANCENPLCEGQGFFKVDAYCLQGYCFLTDAGQTCGSDADCYKSDDCCDCAALPLSVQGSESYCMADCTATQCTNRGLATAKARCVGGTCRLSLQ